MNINTSWKASCFIMEQLISDIISLTSRKTKICGLSSMIKESDNTILEILSLTVLVGKIGEDNHKALTSLSTKRSRKDQLSWSSKLKRKKRHLLLCLDSKKPSYKPKLNRKRKKKNSLNSKPRKRSLKLKSRKSHKKPKSQRSLWVSTLWKSQGTFQKTSDKRSRRRMKISPSHWTYRTMNSHTSCTRSFRFNLLMN